MNQPLKPTTDAIVDLINTYLNLEPNTALVIATDLTSCTELIRTDAEDAIEDIAIIYTALKLITTGEYYHSKVMPLTAKYIVHNYEIIPLASKTTHIVDA